MCFVSEIVYYLLLLWWWWWGLLSVCIQGVWEFHWENLVIWQIVGTIDKGKSLMHRTLWNLRWQYLSMFSSGDARSTTYYENMGLTIALFIFMCKSLCSWFKGQWVRQAIWQFERIRFVYPILLNCEEDYYPWIIMASTIIVMLQRLGVIKHNCICGVPIYGS